MAEARSGLDPEAGPTQRFAHGLRLLREAVGNPDYRSMARRAGCAPDWTEPDRSHGRTVRRSIWVTDAAGIDFPHVKRVVRIRRDHYDSDGCLLSKEIIHAVTSLTEKKPGPGDAGPGSRSCR